MLTGLDLTIYSSNFITGRTESLSQSSEKTLVALTSQATAPHCTISFYDCNSIENYTEHGSVVYRGSVSCMTSYFFISFCDHSRSCLGVKTLMSHGDLASLKPTVDHSGDLLQLVGLWRKDYSFSPGATVYTMAEVEGLTQAEAKELKDAFSLFDKDGNGTIDVKELGPVMRALGQNPTQKELQDLMKKADMDASGSLGYEEYVQVINSFALSPKDVEIQLRQAFLVFDRDKSGTLNLSELREVLCGMGEPLTEDEATYVLRKIDKNNDGMVDAEEFVQFLCKIV
ncbi:hypothetical protein RRG08_039106 [Elysia crispata]|uniref:EF-hand domain-containing protein n=1 Tax=Elysia crispata TaxID=231223 RepID=A0AAE1DIT1_9GAST|nr:hypothetical protein RRG08_039106 [Elysia crispata]